MPSVEICIDVPNIEVGARFYIEALGFDRETSPVANVAVLSADNLRVCLLQRAEGSQPSPSAEHPRSYRRHWTPVHLDVVVPDIERALERAVEAGATLESEIETDEHGSWVSCADPFGHGFCFICPR